MSKSSSIFFTTLLLVYGSLFSSVSYSDANHLLRDSRYTWEEMQMPSKPTIPSYLVENAAGILIIPNAIKGGFIIGGIHGTGVLIKRNRKTGDFSAPLFVSLKGASLGLQIGVSSLEIVFLIMNERGVEILSKGKLTIGTDLSATAGPSSKSFLASSDILLQSDLYTYAKSKGLFLGVSLKGAFISPYDKFNRLLYGQEYDIYSILFKDLAPTTKDGQRLIESINQT